MHTKLAENTLEACEASDIQFYLDSIGRIQKEFNDYLHSESRALSYPLWEIAVGRELFGFLWRLKPNRYSGCSHFLTDLLDAYNSGDPDASGANCTALTALYNILGEMMDIPVFALDPGNHILSRIEAGRVKVNIENTSPKGFGVKEIQVFENHPAIDLDKLQSLENDFIVATTYFNSASAAYKMGDFNSAWELNEKAWKTHPDLAQSALRSALMRVSD